MQIQISWLLQKPTDLDLHCLQRQGVSGFSRTRVNNQPIEIVLSFKYLGVYFHKNGNWYSTQKRIAQHASYSLHNLFTIFNQIDLPVSKKADLFDTLVFPVLNYAAEIWGAHNGPDIEVIHTKFCRKLLTVK